MSHKAEKQARVEAMLGELAELSLMVAKELATRLRESEDTNETVALAGAFQKASRDVRLTLALDLKLDRDAARDAREAETAEATATDQRQAEATRFPPGPLEARKTRVSALVKRLVWNECEGDSEEYEVLFGDLTARLDEAALSDDFEVLPIETLAQRVIADMGLYGELTLSLCEPPPGDAPQRTPQLADTG